jgi:hypothetical protein
MAREKAKSRGKAKGITESREKEFARLVEQLRRESNDKRYESRPQVRVWMIIQQMRIYTEAVMRANKPRDFKGSSTDPRNIARLRKHRATQKDIADPKIGVTPLAASLAAVSSQFVIGEESGWQISASEWEKKIWTPLHEWVARSYQTLFGRDVPTVIPELELIQLEKDESQLEHQLLDLMQKAMPEDDDYPVADESTFKVYWRGEECDLGNSDGFRVMSRLLEMRGGYVSYEEIGDMLYKENMTAEAIRQLVHRLGESLKNSALKALAPCIIADNEMVKFNITKVAEAPPPRPKKNRRTSS